MLTSHSMEECETLCNRLIIMVNGQISCIGSPLHLKSKFGNGYTIQIRVSHSSMNGSAEEIEEENENFKSIQHFIQTTFPKNKLNEIHNNLLSYELYESTNEDGHDYQRLKCSTIFGAIERVKQKFKIVDYSVCQTNLEQIFLSFAKYQQNEIEK